MLMTKTVIIIGIAATLILTGCDQVDPTVGYSSQSLYRTDMHTVYVEMFQSESFQRGLEFELTRALAQQIELKTPYKVVSDRRKADTIIYGRIDRISENTLIQQRELDRPLANEVVLVATVTWQDRRDGDLILDGQKIRVAGDYIALLGAGRDSAAKQAAHEAALRIVEAMQKVW